MANIFNRTSYYCNKVLQHEQTIKNIDEFMYNNPAYTTHNINMEKILDSSLPTIPKIMAKRSLPDISTKKFIDTIFEAGTTEQILLDFTDLVYHTLNKNIMTNINILLLFKNQPLLDLNKEHVLVIFKGGNVLHIYYKFMEHLIYILNPTFAGNNQNIYKKNREYFKISDCDFNLYIVTESPHRYNLLASFTVPLLIRAMKDLQEFFETQFTQQYIPPQPAIPPQPPIVPQPLGLNYTIDPEDQRFSIKDITKLDQYITNDNFILLGLQVPFPIEYIDGLTLFKRVINYNFNRNAYILYHIVNYLIICQYYSGLPNDTPLNQAKRLLVSNIFDTGTQAHPDVQPDALDAQFYQLLLARKIELLNESIAIKRDRLAAFYTNDKITRLMTSIMEEAYHVKDGLSNQLIEYRNNLDITKRNIKYGEQILKEYTFTGFTANVDVNTFTSTTPIIRTEQLAPMLRNSMVMYPNYRLENIDLLTVQNNQQPPTPLEHYNYLTMSFIKSGFTNSLFNVAFSLLRIKFNIGYTNSKDAGALNIVKHKYRVNPDGTRGAVIPDDVPDPTRIPQVDDDPNIFQMPSELIDLGIAHYSDFNYKHMIHHMDEFDKTFSSISINLDQQDFIIGYSLNYLGYDIYQMLWEQTSMPWSDLKFGKRLDRFFMVILYDFIRNLFLDRINNRYSVDISLAEYQAIITHMGNEYRIFTEIRTDLDTILTGSANNYTSVGGKPGYRTMLGQMITKYFKYPNLIETDFLLKINELSFSNLLETTDRFAHLGIIMKTVLHFIYNCYVIEYFNSEQIYDFYYNASIKSNFIFTTAMQNYLGKDNNGNIIAGPRPRPDPDLDIVKDIIKYLKKYNESLSLWIDFFNNNILLPQYDGFRKCNILYNLLAKNIQNIAEHAGGSKTKKNKVRKTQKNTGKKTIINKKHKGGRLPTAAGNTSLIVGKSFADASTPTEKPRFIEAIEAIEANAARAAIKTTAANAAIKTNVASEANEDNEGIEELPMQKEVLANNTTNHGFDEPNVNTTKQTNTQANTQAKLNFNKIGYMNYENFSLFKEDVVKRYRTVNLEGSFVNDMTDLY